jgi:hypothetical protein
MTSIVADSFEGIDPVITCWMSLLHSRDLIGRRSGSATASCAVPS